MDINKAKILLENLLDRIEEGDDGKYRILGSVTPKEIEALRYVVSANVLNDDRGSVGATDSGSSGSPSPADPIDNTNESQAPLVSNHDSENDEKIELNLSSLSLPSRDSNYRVCMDFGTAMSKATFVRDEDDDDLEFIEVLELGIPGDQEGVDEYMLVSSVYIDTEGKLWFGHKAVEQAQLAPDDGYERIDNIKRALSEDNLESPLPSTFNSTSHELTYEEIVLAYLTFFTWTINQALASGMNGLDISCNFNRRFAMPCFPRANARRVEEKLKTMLGEAQVLSDTFGDEIHHGLPLARFLKALQLVRAEKRTYPFIDGSVTEPLGVAGSLLSWKKSEDQLALVVDIGAGTSDFSLYRLKVEVKDDEVVTGTGAGEVEGTARGITEAGNHLDHILLGLIIEKSGVDSSHPKYLNILHALKRDIRDYKESLFGPNEAAFVTLYTGEHVDIPLEEFLQHPAVQLFEESLRSTMIDILESADPSWIDWVRANPRRYLTLVLTGGGATLPMVRRLAERAVTVNGVEIPVAPSRVFPAWLQEDYPDLEDHYLRVAVSLGGARKYTISSLGPLKSTGIGLGEYKWSPSFTGS